MSDLGPLLERADRAVAHVPAPTGGLERIQRRRNRRRRNQRIAAGVVGIAVFLVPIWIVTNGGLFDRAAETPAGPGPTTPVASDPPDAPRVGLVGLPPEGATPSTPKRGDLVLGFLFGHFESDPGRFSVNVYEDGRLIWERLGDGPGDPSTGLLEQRLSPEGVELVRSEVLSTGLFDRDRDLVGAFGLYSGEIKVRDSDRLIRVAWGGLETRQDATTVATPEQVSALEGLDARLSDPASWLPASAWEVREIRPYVPPRYAVCYEGRPRPSIDVSRLLTLLPAAAEDMLRAKHRTGGQYPDHFGSTVDYWCSDLTTDEARALAEVLDDAGAVGRSNVFGAVYDFQPPGRSDTTINISFSPILP